MYFQFRSLLLLVFLWIGVLAASKKSKTSGKKKADATLTYCPLKHCADEATEIAKWECLGKSLYRPLEAGKDNLSKTYFVEHDCGGVGWGNSIRGMSNAAAIAAVTGRRLIVTHPSFNRLFFTPNESMIDWDFGLKASFGKGMNEHELAAEVYRRREIFKYEDHGRAPKRFDKWTRSIQQNPRNSTYTKQILVAGICGGERELITTGGCMQHVMPSFLQCMVSDGADRYSYVAENMISVPFFHTLFTRPKPELHQFLQVVRARLELPSLEPGSEPVPGAWGLRTPNYYILALHFRRVPIGFEPLALELNEKRNLEYRLSTLKGFWDHAVKAANAAKKIAACRQQQLLIYFATDDVKNLRPEAQTRLSRYGRVVFGLTEDEVGHMSPQWTSNDFAKLAKVQESVSATWQGAQAEPSRPVEVEIDTYAHGKTLLKITEEIASPQRTKKAEIVHGNAAIAEWWILAHAHWLVGHSGTSFSETASGVGLGPRGVMERFDMVHGVGHVQSNIRRDWNGDACSIVGAADPVMAKQCPNTPNMAK